MSIKGSIYCPSTRVGETIEEKVSRITNNNEPINDSSSTYYQERKDGVKPEFNIRTDRFDVAIDAMNLVQKTKIAQREERAKSKDQKAATDVSAVEIRGTEPAA